MGWWWYKRDRSWWDEYDLGIADGGESLIFFSTKYHTNRSWWCETYMLALVRCFLIAVLDVLTRAIKRKYGIVDHKMLRDIFNLVADQGLASLRVG